MTRTTIYICADSTLTYGPYGGKDKIIPQALPVGVADDEAHARRTIELVGRRAYNDPAADPDFRIARRGRPIPPGYGPDWRYYYSLPEFERDNVDTLPAVTERMEEMLRRTREET